MERTVSTTVWHWEALRERMKAESETSALISIELHVSLQICYTNSFEDTEQEQNKFCSCVHIMSAITLNLPYYPLTLCVKSWDFIGDMRWSLFSTSQSLTCMFITCIFIYMFARQQVELTEKAISIIFYRITVWSMLMN